MPHFRKSGMLGPTPATLEVWERLHGFVPNLLWLAAAGEQPAMVTRLLNEPALRLNNVEALDQQDPDHGWTPMRMLLEMPYSLFNVSTRNGKTREDGDDDTHQQAAIALLNAGADPYRLDNDGLTPITAALQHRAVHWLQAFAKHPSFDAQRVQALTVPLAKAPSWDQQVLPRDHQAPDILSYALLHAPTCVATLLDAGLDAKRANVRGSFPLHLARRPEHVALLLDHGADPWVTTPDGVSLVGAYARWVSDTQDRNRMIRAVQQVQQTQAQPNDAQAQQGRANDFPSLFEAIAGTKDTFVKLFKTVVMASQGTLTVDTRDGRGRTLLEVSLVQRKTALVNFLLEQGADPQALGSHGLPVFMSALAYGPFTNHYVKETEKQTGLWQRMLACGVDLEKRLPDGRSLLLATIMNVERLREDIPATGFLGKLETTPKTLWWIVQRLRQHGLDLRVQDRIDAFPMLSNEERSSDRDVRWPVALAVAVLPSFREGSFPSAFEMGFTHENHAEVLDLLVRALSPVGVRQLPATVPPAIASAWLATLIGHHARVGRIGVNSPLMNSLTPHAKLPIHHPLTTNVAWQAHVLEHGGENRHFLSTLEAQALKHVAEEVVTRQERSTVSRARPRL